jgi:hypothetical protein
MRIDLRRYADARQPLRRLREEMLDERGLHRRQCKPTTPTGAALTQCYVTPLKCSTICASLGKACASTCGATGTATAIVYDKNDFDCSGQGYVKPDPNFCGYEFPSLVYGSMQCCCGPK